MEPILKSVAREYTKRYGDLKPVCFLFPNKRCSVFFKKYLSECGVMTEDLPHILTISEFTSQVARKIEASRIEQLFILYKAYIDIIGDKGEEIEFEVFRGWGETVLGDFNTVDLYLHDSSEIFKNINDYRSLATDFLTEDQKEVMKEYFGVEDFQDSKRFWKQFDDPASTSELKKKFINLWQILGPLHQKFISVLSSKGLGSSGTIFREAAKKIEERGKEILPYLKIVAVGFNALNEAERIIFRSLQQIGGNPGYDDFADFIWDAAGYFLNSRDFSASRFVLSNKKRFPSPKWWQEIHASEIESDFPDFRIISAPSVTAQAKVAGEILKEYKTKEEKRRVADAEVALVLPDESLLPNLLYSLPETLGDINLTMGYSLKQTSVASFVSLLRRLFMSKREGKSTISFYSKDLKLFFAHPYAYILFQVSEIEKLMGHVLQFHKISVDNKEIENHIPSF